MQNKGFLQPPPQQIKQNHAKSNMIDHHFECDSINLLYTYYFKSISTLRNT